jgi:uncharacterized damage-inducible protein DinB
MTREGWVIVPLNDINGGCSMAENFLAKLFEHNNWANAQIIRACSALSDAQLDGEPTSATKGSIRRTLEHLVNSQHGYLQTLTVPVEARRRAAFTFPELEEAARISGEGLLALAKDVDKISKTAVRTRDGNLAEPWVVMLQIINHATEHREQVNSMLSALGAAPLEQDGWKYGEVTHALMQDKR